MVSAEKNLRRPQAFTIKPLVVVKKNFIVLVRACAINIHNPPKVYIVLVCDGCGKEFTKLKSQQTYDIKRGCVAFNCSRICSAKNRRVKTNKSIKKKEYSPFRLFIHKAKNNGSRRRVLEFDITPEYLKELYDIQGGTCPLSGWHLRLPSSSQKWEKGYAYSIDNASLDRIDNSKGYVEGNVRFVALITNFARNQFTDEEVIKFGRAVAEHNKSI